MDLVEKALNTNGCKILELAEPRWNINTLEKNIALLEKEIEELRHKAFNCTASKNCRNIASGLDYNLLQSKLGRLDSMNVRLKSLKTLNDEPRRNNKGQSNRFR